MDETNRKSVGFEVIDDAKNFYKKLDKFLPEHFTLDSHSGILLLSRVMVKVNNWVQANPTSKTKTSNTGDNEMNNEMTLTQYKNAEQLKIKYCIFGRKHSAITMLKVIMGEKLKTVRDSKGYVLYNKSLKSGWKIRYSYKLDYVLVNGESKDGRTKGEFKVDSCVFDHILTLV